MKKMYGIRIQDEYWQNPEYIVAFETIEELKAQLKKFRLIDESHTAEDENGRLASLYDRYGEEWEEEVERWGWDELLEEYPDELIEILCP